MIPPTIHPSVRSGAERKLFEVIRDAPGTEDWVCLHSLAIAKHETKRRAEIDFLLLTRQGIFVLEVKGGRISRDEGVWRFTDRWDNSVTKYESPFDQASSAMFALETDIRERFKDNKRRRRLLFGFGAMFPDVRFDVTGTDIDRRQLYDRDCRNKPLTQFIDDLTTFWRERSSLGESPGRYAPTKADIDAIVQFLRGDFDLIPSLGAQADASSHQLLSLEKEQYVVLDGLELYSRPRMLVQGGAGTGKTLLAAEVARREARRTKGNVLLLCYNRVLASVLENNVKAGGEGRVVAKSVYSLLYELIEKSSLYEEFQQRCASVDQAEIYSKLIPEYTSLAILDMDFSPFESLVIDEAQDMMSMGMLDCLDGLVKGGLNNGRWWVFCDINGQASVFGVYEEDALYRLIGLGHVVILPTNRRNTIPIATETEIITSPKFPAKATVDGIPVKTRWYSKSSEQPAALARVLKSLLDAEVLPYQITVLSPRKIEDCCAMKLSEADFEPVKRENAWKVGTRDLNKITFSTVSSFKGLENDFIVLTDVDELNSEWWRGVVYVGMSRARVGLNLLINSNLKTACDERQKAWLRTNLDGNN